MKSKQYPTEVKTRAVELLIESQKNHPSLWAAIQAIAPKFGCTPETLLSWHQKHLSKQNPVTVTTESQAARIAELEGRFTIHKMPLLTPMVSQIAC